MNKHELAKKINELEGLTNEEKSELLKLLRSQKKYGLVWEDKPEDAEQRMLNEQPVLEEVPERAIISDDADAVNHILIEGDNIEALTALSYTHSGKIDIIYIDPPYNTGNKDFKYNDVYVDKEDAYYNSKWLSFMNKRLKIAKTLLKEDGIIFISIGDDEISQLKILCDEIFSRQCLGLLPRVAKSGSKQGTYFRPTKDYVLAYCKNVNEIKGFHTKEFQVKAYPLEDEDGRKYRKAHSLFQASLDPLRGCKNQRYYMEAPDGTLILPPGNAMPLEKKDAAYIVPETRVDKVWRWSYQSYLAKKDRIMFAESKKSPLIDSFGNHTDWNVYEKKYEDEEKDGDIDYNLPDDIIYDYLNSSATAYLNNMGIDFPFSKPWELVAYLIDITGKGSNITVLDFFAGSGTTLDALMKMNDGDGGHRLGLLATNNENNICEDVTYPRIKNVIKGYTTVKGKVKVPGLTHNNLRYYKTKFVPRDKSPKNLRDLMVLSTDMLCIRNDAYLEKPFAGKHINKNIARYFESNDGKKRMLIIFIEEAIPAIVELIKRVHAESSKTSLSEMRTSDIADTSDKPGKLMVYVFSANGYAFNDEFEEVADGIELCAMPDALLNAYRRVLPKRKPQYLPDALEEMQQEAQEMGVSEVAMERREQDLFDFDQSYQVPRMAASEILNNNKEGDAE